MALKIVELMDRFSMLDADHDETKIQLRKSKIAEAALRDKVRELIIDRYPCPPGFLAQWDGLNCTCMLQDDAKETLLECFERGFHENAQKELEDGLTAGSMKLGADVKRDPEMKLNPST